MINKVCYLFGINGFRIFAGVNHIGSDLAISVFPNALMKENLPKSSKSSTPKLLPSITVKIKPHYFEGTLNRKVFHYQLLYLYSFILLDR